MDAAFKWFINGWVALAALVNIVAIVGLFVAAPTLWDGWVRVRGTYSPFNVWNSIAEIVLFSPALGAMYWRGCRQERTKR